MTLRIGSVCTGYGGLDKAVQQVFGGELAWVSDIDPGACQIIAHRMPDIPNLGDLTTTRWEDVEPVDIYIGGYPCQPFSLAGDLKGTDDERHLWPFIASSLRVLRPRYAIFENVANHLRLGFDTVLCDLADLGFDVEWVVVRADEVGAPHQRRRLIFLATATDAPRPGRAREGVRGRVAERGAVAAHAANLGHERSRSARGRGLGPTDHGVAAPDAKGVRRGEGRSEPARQQGRPGSALGRGAVAADADRGRLSGDAKRNLGPDGPGQQAPRRDNAERPGVQRGASADTHSSGRGSNKRDVQQGQPDAEWGRFAPAIARWEACTGRRAPRATDDRRRLSPPFVEWMMGLPAGHVTAVPGLTRTQQLKALGNGVVPQQAAAAIRLLADRAGVWAEAAA
jgi:DNA (cytosine-5)-methyltransferase 1